MDEVILNQILINLGGGLILVGMIYFAFICTFIPAVQKIWIILSCFGLAFLTTQLFFFIDNPFIVFAINAVIYVALSLLFVGKISTKLTFSLLLYSTSVLAKGLSVALFGLIYQTIILTTIIQLPLILLAVQVFRLCILKNSGYMYYKTPIRYTVAITIILTGTIFISLFFISSALNDSYHSSISITIYLLLSAFVIAAIIWLYKTILNFIENAEHIKRKSLLLERNSAKYSAADSNQKLIAGFRHNFNFYLLSLKSLLKGQKYEEAGRLVERLIGNFATATNTGNASIDAMLNYYNQKADNLLGVDLNFDLSIPSELRLDEVLTATILGVALENAVEACAQVDRRRRYVNVTMKITEHKELLVTIENPYSVEPNVDGVGNFITTKKNPQEHGQGIRTIQELFSEKKGHIHMEYGNGTFRFLVLFYDVFPRGSGRNF